MPYNPLHSFIIGFYNISFLVEYELIVIDNFGNLWRHKMKHHCNRLLSLIISDGKEKKKIKT